MSCCYSTMMIHIRATVLCLSAFLLLIYIVLQQWEKGSLLQNAVIRTKKTRTRWRHDNNIRNGTAKTAGNGATDHHGNDDCTHICLERVEQHEECWGGNLLDIMDLHKSVKNAHATLESKLQQDYGSDHFQKIFYNGTTSRGRTVFRSASGTSDGISIQRLKRKLKLKVLRMQNRLEQELQVAGECHCGDEAQQDVRRRHLTHDDLQELSMSDYYEQDVRRHLTHDPQELPLSDHYEQVVWATGGHSAAAGHGNLLNESYTAVLEDSISPVFASVGIHFEGRNHAMGGTPSAPEIALCLEEVFGNDVDILTYDYAMCDAGREQKKYMYDQRVGLHPNHPALLNINILAVDFSHQRKMLQREEERGMTVLYLDPVEFQEMKHAFPDTFGLNAEQINSMPPLVRHFKCRDFFEKGDPTCGEMKYDSSEVCPDRNGMADWHPGWKMHALWGNTFALFLSELLMEAISELSSVTKSNRTAVLNQLQSEEEADFERFLQTATAGDSTDYDMVPKESELLTGANASVFFTESSVCHTARLPSQERYLGILTETSESGISGYFKGIPLEQARNLSSDVNSEVPMPLVWDESERQTCEVELNRDYKDFFYASSKMGWTYLTVPNKAEKRAYMKESQKLKGLLVVCLEPCAWGECEKGDMRKDALLDGRVLMQVNRSPVTMATDVVEDCMVLRGTQGHYWQPNDAGQYVLKARVVGNGTEFASLRISSLILL